MAYYTLLNEVSLTKTGNDFASPPHEAILPCEVKTFVKVGAEALSKEAKKNNSKAEEQIPVV